MAVAFGITIMVDVVSDVDQTTLPLALDNRTISVVLLKQAELSPEAVLMLMSAKSASTNKVSELDKQPALSVMVRK